MARELQSRMEGQEACIDYGQQRWRKPLLLPSWRGKQDEERYGQETLWR
jgi:hypothetical protein